VNATPLRGCYISLSLMVVAIGMEDGDRSWYKDILMLPDGGGVPEQPGEGVKPQNRIALQLSSKQPWEGNICFTAGALFSMRHTF
jgi:hypothetical protein